MTSWLRSKRSTTPFEGNWATTANSGGSTLRNSVPLGIMGNTTTPARKRPPVVQTAQRFTRMLNRVGIHGTLTSRLSLYALSPNNVYEAACRFEAPLYPSIQVTVGNGWVYVNGNFFAVGKRYPKHGMYTLGKLKDTFLKAVVFERERLEAQKEKEKEKEEKKAVQILLLQNGAVQITPRKGVTLTAVICNVNGQEFSVKLLSCLLTNPKYTKHRTPR